MAQHASYMAGIEYNPADMMQREDDWINPGVLSSSDLVVTAGSGLSVNVSGASQGSTGGSAWLPGGYRFYNDSIKNVVLTTANATNPRIDIIVACVDTSTNPYTATIKAITGTPAVSPVVPSISGTLAAIPLAQIAVGTNATTLSAGNITDVRTVATLAPLATHLAEKATETTTGHIQLATAAEVTAGTEATKAVTSKNLKTELDKKIDSNNYIRGGGYAVTAGTSTAYTITLTPAPTAYSDGQQFIINPHTDCGATPTLNINGLGTGTIVKQDGSAIAAGDIKANVPLPLVRVGSNFFIRSSGGSNIKSIQSGNVLLSSNNPIDIPISKVDRTKSIIIYNAGNDQYSGSTTVIDFTSDTSIQVIPAESSSRIFWQVIEFNNVKSIQRGNVSLGNGVTTQNISIASVNTLKSILIVDSLTSGTSYNGHVNGCLTSNQITLYKNYYALPTVYWQLIEFN